MSVLLGTLCLNEMQWLPQLWEQHKNWPELASWVFVEAADAVYAATNPTLVSSEGLSVDGTSEFLAQLAERDPRVVYIRHGITSNPNPAAGKIAARQRYLDIAENVKPEFVIAIDADEFYTRNGQAELLRWMRKYPKNNSFVFHRREIWRPPSIVTRPLFTYEVVGGFWAIACCHWWRWQAGMHYGDCHNSPYGGDGVTLHKTLMRLDKERRAPQMIHLGYAADLAYRVAKCNYYAARGEAEDPTRSWYVRSRAAWESWTRKTALPKQAKVIPYKGDVPEVFR